jgi:hypothetical protein
MKNKVATKVQVSEALQHLVITLSKSQKDMKKLRVLKDVSFIVDEGFKFEIEIDQGDGTTLAVPITVGDPILIEEEVSS